MDELRIYVLVFEYADDGIEGVFTTEQAAIQYSVANKSYERQMHVMVYEPNKSHDWIEWITFTPVDGVIVSRNNASWETIT